LNIFCCPIPPQTGTKRNKKVFEKKLLNHRSREAFPATTKQKQKTKEEEQRA